VGARPQQSRACPCATLLPVAMKLRRVLRATIGLLLATDASAQGVISRMGGFMEQVDPLSAPVDATSTDALSLFLQQAPPTFPTAGEPGATATSAVSQTSVEPAPLQVFAPAPAAQMPMVSVNDMLSATAPGPAATPPIDAPPARQPKGMLTLRSMKVANGGTEGSKVFFGASSEFAVGTDSAGNFVVQQASAPSPLIHLDSADTLHLNSARVEALALDAQMGISVRGVKQWQLLYSEDFSVEGAGWSRKEVSECAGVNMLGGFCKFSRGEVNKTFAGLPPHKQLRVVAVYHFIDRWIGETGFMKLDIGMNECATVVWSERHAQQEAKNGLSLCGDAGTPEGKFSAPIDVTIPHHKDSVTVAFGSTMDDADPCDESWGISALEIHIRN